MDKFTLRENFRMDLEKELKGSLSLLKIFLSDIKDEKQFYAFLKNETSLFTIYDISEKDVKEILFDITSGKFFSKEEIKELKNKIIKNENDTFVSDMQILKYFSSKELDLNTASKIIGKKLSFQIFSFIQKWLIESPEIFNTLNKKMLNDTIIALLGSNYERILFYESTQQKIINITSNSEKNNVFCYLLNYIENISASEIEVLCNNINSLEKNNPNFMHFVSSTKISPSTLAFFVYNPSKAKGIQSFDEINNYEQNMNAKYEEQFLNADLKQRKEILFAIFYKKSLDEIKQLLRKYGDEIEKLEKIEKDIELKKYVFQMVQMKKIYNASSMEELKYLYEYKKNFTHNSLELNINLEKKLSYSFNKTISKTLQNSKPKLEIIEDCSHLGYRIVKIDGDYSKMVSVLDAFGNENFRDISLTEKLHGHLSKVNHARCYSMISNKNLGLYKTAYNQDAIIIQMKDFAPDAIIAASNKDIGSNSSTNISNYIEDYTYYTIGENYPNKIRDGYSEFVIENEINGKMHKISSFLCIDAVNDATISAAKEIAKFYGEVIDIEIVDTKELISSHFLYRVEEYEKFLKTLDAKYLIHYINQFLNDTSAFGNINRFNEYFLPDGALYSRSCYENILYAVDLIKDNPLEMQKFKKYIEKEKRISSLISLVYDEKLDFEEQIVR